MIADFLPGLFRQAQEQFLDSCPCPGSLAKEGEARLDRRIELEAANRHGIRHPAPAKIPLKHYENLFERHSMQGILWVRPRGRIVSRVTIHA